MEYTTKCSDCGCYFRGGMLDELCDDCWEQAHPSRSVEVLVLVPAKVVYEADRNGDCNIIHVELANYAGDKAFSLDPYMVKDSEKQLLGDLVEIESRREEEAMKSRRWKNVVEEEDEGRRLSDAQDQIAEQGRFGDGLKEMPKPNPHEVHPIFQNLLKAMGGK